MKEATVFIPTKRTEGIAGRYVLMKCPWHDEVTPSCAIDRDYLSVHCFGCGAHGTAEVVETTDDLLKLKLSAHVVLKTEADMAAMEVARFIDMVNRDDLEEARRYIEEGGAVRLAEASKVVLEAAEKIRNRKVN